jgi:predicted nucleic acid-binding protein
MIVLDTTILVYAVGERHPYADACREVVRLLAEGGLRATTTPEVIQEFLHVRARRRSRGDAARLARSFAKLLSPLLAVGDDDLEAGLALYESSRLGAFDAVLAATALRRGCRLLLSADRAFTTVAELPVAGPSDEAFLERVRAAVI